MEELLTTDVTTINIDVATQSWKQSTNFKLVTFTSDEDAIAGVMNIGQIKFTLNVFAIFIPKNHRRVIRAGLIDI